MVGFIASSMLHTMQRQSAVYACRASQLHEAQPIHQQADGVLQHSCVILLCTGYNRVSTLIAVYSDHAMETFTRKQVRLRSALRHQESLERVCCYERYSDIINKLSNRYAPA